MTEIQATNDFESPKVTVWFKKSSTKDGGEGFELSVQEGADEVEAGRVMALAIKLREQALAVIQPDNLERDLARSLDAARIVRINREAVKLTDMETGSETAFK